MSGNSFNSGYIGVNRFDSSVVKGGILGGRRHFLKRLDGTLEFVPSGGVVEDELLFYLDFGNVITYPGTGIYVTDIVTGTNQGVLRNNPTFVSGTPSYMELDGTDDYIAFDVGDITSNTITVETWFNYTFEYVSNAPILLCFNSYDVWTRDGALGFNTFNSDIYGLNPERVTALGIHQTWTHYTFIMKDNVPYTNNKIYINAVDQNDYLTQVNSSERGDNRNFNNGLMSIGGISTTANLTANTSYAPQLQIGEFRVYNKELSSDDILSNYNASSAKYL